MIPSRSRPQRLLIISPYPIVPPSTGGMVHTHALATQFVRLGWDVTVLTPYYPGQRSRLRSETFTLVQAPYPFLLPFFLSDRFLPYGYAVSFHPGYGLWLRKFLRRFDVFQFEHNFFAGLLRWIPRGSPVVYSAHNVEFDYHRAECSRPGLCDIVGRRMYALEEAVLHRSRLVLSCSSKQRTRFRELYGVSPKKVAVVPNGVQRVVAKAGPPDPSRLLRRLPELERFPIRAVFSGSDVDHNRIAVRTILDRLAPEAGDECGFVINGGCGRRFRGRAPGNVIFDPDPDSFDDYANSGLIGLNPVTQGSGTQLKFSQYLAHGLPVISTKFGARGYEDLERYVTICSVEEFVPALRAKPVLSPECATALQDYRWEVIVGRVFDRYSTAVAESAQ